MEHRRNYKRLKEQERYRKYKNVTREGSLGTGFLSSTPYSNFKKESREVVKELRRLRLPVNPRPDPKHDPAVILLKKIVSRVNSEGR